MSTMVAVREQYQLVRYQLRFLHSVSTVPADFFDGGGGDKNNVCRKMCFLQLNPSSRLALVHNQGHDSIAAFAVGTTTSVAAAAAAAASVAGMGFLGAEHENDATASASVSASASVQHHYHGHLQLGHLGLIGHYMLPPENVKQKDFDFQFILEDMQHLLLMRDEDKDAVMEVNLSTGVLSYASDHDGDIKRNCFVCRADPVELLCGDNHNNRMSESIPHSSSSHATSSSSNEPVTNIDILGLGNVSAPYLMDHPDSLRPDGTGEEVSTPEATTSPLLSVEAVVQFDLASSSGGVIISDTSDADKFGSFVGDRPDPGSNCGGEASDEMLLECERNI
jgi:hypothetical protein